MLKDDPFWDPVHYDGWLLVIGVVGIILATIGILVWYWLQPEEPDRRDRPDLVQKAVQRDQERAAHLRRRLDADTGRADANEPELR